MGDRKPVAADFFARRPHFVDHLAPAWKAMDWRGKFYVPAYLYDYAVSQGLEVTALEPIGTNPLEVVPPGFAPLVTCAYHDMQLAINARSQRRMILMEHGVGLVFGCNHPGYAGGLGMRRKVNLFLAPNEYIRAKTAKSLPNASQVVIGTPKLDSWAEAKEPRMPKKPTICISFHWDGSGIEPEAGTAWMHYQEFLPTLAKEKGFKLIGHGHPKAIDNLAGEYENMGIEVVRDFREVMQRADIYVNDASSTMFEFCVTGKPVVIMNAPWFRKNKRFGIRFWDYSDIGPQVEGPEELVNAIEMMIKYPEQFSGQRQKMVQDLYPHLGYAAKRAAVAIQAYCGAIYG
jgi:hypothetical protein